MGGLCSSSIPWVPHAQRHLSTSPSEEPGSAATLPGGPLSGPARKFFAIGAGSQPALAAMGVSENRIAFSPAATPARTESLLDVAGTVLRRHGSMSEEATLISPAHHTWSTGPRRGPGSPG
jgi:hypothetical protein